MVSSSVFKKYILMKNYDGHQLGSNPAQRSKEKVAREEVIRKREAITSWALMIIMVILMQIRRMTTMTMAMIKMRFNLEL